MSRKSNGPRLARSSLAIALSAALVLASCPLQGVAYALEVSNDGVEAASDEAAELSDGAATGESEDGEAATAEAEDGESGDFTDIADAAVREDSADDAEAADGADATDTTEETETVEVADSAEATEDPIAQVDALGIPTDPEGVEGYDPAADQEPEWDENAPTGYDEYAGADDEGIALQSSDSVRVGDWSYCASERNGQAVYVIDQYYGGAASITLPATLGGKQMYGVEFGSSRLPSTVTSVTIPASIKEIGASAFCGTKVTSVTFAANSQLISIGRSAFERTPLTEFIIPANVKTVGYDAFANSKLSKLILNTELEPMPHTENVLSGSDKFERPEHFNPCAGCSTVTFVVPSGCKNYKVENGALLSKDGAILYAQLSNLGGGNLHGPERREVPRLVRHVQQHHVFGHRPATGAHNHGAVLPVQHEHPEFEYARLGYTCAGAHPRLLHESAERAH